MTSGTKSDFSYFEILKILRKKIVSLRFCKYFKTHSVKKAIKKLKKYILVKIKLIYSHINLEELKFLLKKISELINIVLHSKLFKKFINNSKKYKKAVSIYLKKLFKNFKFVKKIIKVHATPKFINGITKLILDITNIKDFSIGSILKLYTNNSKFLLYHLKDIKKNATVDYIISQIKNLIPKDLIIELFKNKNTLEIIKKVFPLIMNIVNKRRIIKSPEHSINKPSKVVPDVPKVPDVPVVKKVIKHHKNNQFNELFSGKITDFKIRM